MTVTDIIDISWPITSTTTAYKNRQTITIQSLKTFETDQVRETMISCGSHTGTHIDAPAHFLQHGATIDQLPLRTFIGSCVVLDLTAVPESIGPSELHTHAIKEHDIILFKTRNSRLDPTAPFDAQFVYLNGAGADYLAQKKSKLLVSII